MHGKTKGAFVYIFSNVNQTIFMILLFVCFFIFLLYTGFHWLSYGALCSALSRKMCSIQI